LSLPELPEVETISRALRNGGRDAPSIVGWKIISAQLRWPKTLAGPSWIEFQNKIIDQQVLDIHRRGKFIVIHLDNHFLVVHLRMSGDLRVEADEQEIQKHDHLIIWFENGMHLAFNDPRKFGRVWLLDDVEPLFSQLGPEPFEIESAEYFHQMLTKHNRQIKPLLMDQHFISGMGNIYTDEALHKANLHPLINSSAISSEQAKNLLNAIKEVLNLGIVRNGASIDWFYRGGSFQNEFQVYGRNGLPCLNCGTLINKIVVGQRGTHYCPTCQPIFPSSNTKEMVG